MSEAKVTSDSIAPSRVRALTQEIVKFGIVGGLGVVVNFAAFNLIRAATPLHVMQSSFIGTCAAIVFNYLGFRYFTYRDRESRGHAREFTLFVVFSAVGLVIENGVLYAATFWLGWDTGLQNNLFKALGITAATCFRFGSYRTWVFRRSAESPAEPPAEPAAEPPARRHTGRHATSVKQALILAGGRATRMRPYTDDAPKAMVPVAEAPIVGYQLAWLAQHGVQSVTISGGYKHKMIMDYAGNGSRFDMEIRYAIEDEPLGRGGGLKYAARHLADPEAPFFVLNGDVITTFSLTELAEHHGRCGGAVTVALSPYRSNWGVAELDDGGLIRGFVQSPELPYWVNAGIYVFNPDVIGLLPGKGDHEDSTFPQLADDGQLIGYRLSGYWRGIDTVKDVIEASEEVRASGRLLPPELRTTGSGA